MVEYASFRNQAEAKSPWSLDEDIRRGFAQSVTNNQPQMALYYVQEIMKAYDQEIAELRNEVKQLRDETSKVATRTTSAKKTAESTDA